MRTLGAMEEVLAPIDFHDHALDDARLADRVARAGHARLRLLHVVAAGDFRPLDGAAAVDGHATGGRARRSCAHPRWRRRAMRWNSSPSDWRHARSNAGGHRRACCRADRTRGRSCRRRSHRARFAWCSRPARHARRRSGVSGVVCVAGAGAGGAARGARRPAVSRSSISLSAQNEARRSCWRAPRRWPRFQPTSPDRAPPASRHSNEPGAAAAWVTHSVGRSRRVTAARVDQSLGLVGRSARAGGSTSKNAVGPGSTRITPAILRPAPSSRPPRPSSRRRTRARRCRHGKPRARRAPR